MQAADRLADHATTADPMGNTKQAQKQTLFRNCRRGKGASARTRRRIGATFCAHNVSREQAQTTSDE
jgi:hypothetical protein